MKIIKVISIVLLIIITNYNRLEGQEKYPFTNIQNNNDILAYWYNCPEDSIYWAYKKGTSFLNSYIQVYGRIPEDSFSVNVKVFSTNRDKIFDRTYFVKKNIKNDSFDVEFNDSFFKITEKVKSRPVNPIKIYAEIKSKNKTYSRAIDCKYHKLYGHITDFEGNPKKGFILIHPDAFELSYGIWSDENGYYEILLPERTYNCFYVNDSFYKTNTLETWSWHMIVDAEQKLDFKIGTGEIYNMNVWTNDGGSSTYFISFRPMVLFPGEKNYNKEINNHNYEIIDMSPDLVKPDLTVEINGKKTEIYSIQKIYETGKGTALPSYILQVRTLPPRIGKQTIKLEFVKRIKIENQSIEQSAMGYYEFYLNFTGNSKYY